LISFLIVDTSDQSNFRTTPVKILNQPKPGIRQKQTPIISSNDVNMGIFDQIVQEVDFSSVFNAHIEVRHTSVS
jgi:hypothetical protein